MAISKPTLVNVIKAVGVVLATVATVLPQRWLDKFNIARKAVVAAAGLVTTTAVALGDLPLAGDASAWVAYAAAAATAVATYWVPNAAPRA